MIWGGLHESNFQSLPALEILVVIIGILLPQYSHELGTGLRKVSGQAIRDALISFISVSSDQRPAKIHPKTPRSNPAAAATM